MTADEMFEKLGYEKHDKKPNHSYFLKYYKDNDNVIYFYDESYGKGVCKSGGFDSMCDDITMDELKAINKKCEELGWLK